jgi:hypothetical protein
LVEHVIRNDGVACSSHASGTKYLSQFNQLCVVVFVAHFD